jgi:hypothetical protein
VIAGTGVAIAGLAGCLGGNGSDGTADDDRSDDGGSDSGTSADATGSDGDDQDLDLAEANVTTVAVEPDGDGAHAFDVTLLHDDEGEEGYANWWQVETLDGDRLGRRDLLHAHGNEPFTRSETISIPEDVECVVVRGHDRTHGYGGQVILVTLSGGATSVRRQGSEPSDFSDADCP